MRFLLTGATGFLGHHAWTALRDAGHETSVLTRDPKRAAKLLPGARLWEWNGTVGLPPEGAFENVDVIVNLIGESIARRWTHDAKRRFRDSRVLPTRSMIERLTGMPTRPRALISIVGSGYYGDRGAEVLTENAAPGTGFLAKLCQEWEQAALSAVPLGIRTVVLRSGVVLARDGGMFKTILRPFRLGVGGRLGSGKQYFPWVHVDDWVGILLHVADRMTAGGAGSETKADGSAVNAVAPEPSTNGEFVVALGKALGRPTALGVPAFVLKVALGEMAEELLLASQRVSPIRVLESGYQFKHPLLAGALANLLHPPDPGP